jgi:hypothetical protein
MFKTKYLNKTGFKEFSKEAEAVADEFVKQLQRRENARKKKPVSSFKKGFKKSSFKIQENREDSSTESKPKRSFFKFGNRTSSTGF